MPVPRQQCMQFVVLGSPGDDPLQDIGEIGKRLNTVLGAEHPSHRLSNARLANSGVPWCTYRSIVVAGYPSTASTALSFLRLTDAAFNVGGGKAGGCPLANHASQSADGGMSIHQSP